ncbi:hypothetical protein ACF09H_29840 [Streptomyces sp. NPDC014983]|uniref:hypothetical protein n=1 Tax=Streptomyces sp. NPDC014983 TaxID=3364933 RepID=UPI0036FE21A2
MNTSAAVINAGVTTPTIRTWCRTGARAAAEQAGGRIIDETSLPYRSVLAVYVVLAPEVAAHFYQLRDGLKRDTKGEEYDES